VLSPAARLILVAVALGALVLSAVLLREPPEPYVVTAIDYHFHDAHPTAPIAPGRGFVVVNEGRNVHNVTIPALDIVTDVQPGGEFTVDDIGGRLAPGHYELFCRFHKDRGMTGVILIVGS
jgi:plastocyanin